MLYRVLSWVGWFAHLADIFGASRKREKPKPEPYAGHARFGMALVVAGFVALIAALAIGNAVEGAANPTATTYTVDQLVDNPNVGSRNYATVTGTVYDWMVETTKNGNYDHAAYLVGDVATDKWIIVQTWKKEGDFEALVGADGNITVTGMLRTDKKEIDGVLSELGSNVPSVNVTNAIILNDGQAPANSAVMAVVAVVAILLVVLLVIGWWIKFLPFKPLALRTSMATQGLTAPIAVRATGVIARTVGGERSFERVAQVQTSPADPTHPEAAALDIVWNDDAGITGVRLVPGVSEVVMGTAWSRKGPRPAIALRFLKYRIVLAFNDEASRDQAFDQLRYSTGLPVSAEGSAARAS